MNDRIYVIIDADDIPTIDFDQVMQTSANTLLYNLAGDKAVVKFRGDTPSFLEGKTQYNQDEILAIKRGEEWTDPNAVP